MLFPLAAFLVCCLYSKHHIVGISFMRGMDAFSCGRGPVFNTKQPVSSTPVQGFVHPCCSFFYCLMQNKNHKPISQLARALVKQIVFPLSKQQDLASSPQHKFNPKYSCTEFLTQLDCLFPDQETAQYSTDQTYIGISQVHSLMSLIPAQGCLGQHPPQHSHLPGGLVHMGQKPGAKVISPSSITICR